MKKLLIALILCLMAVPAFAQEQENKLDNIVFATGVMDDGFNVEGRYGYAHKFFDGQAGIFKTGLWTAVQFQPGDSNQLGEAVILLSFSYGPFYAGPVAAVGNNWIGTEDWVSYVTGSGGVIGGGMWPIEKIGMWAGFSVAFRRVTPFDQDAIGIQPKYETYVSANIGF